jgi:hypothetical protein
MNLRKKVHKLPFDYDNDFFLIGIASHENDYRISWALNQLLGWNLAKTNDFKINHPKFKVEVNYSMYQFTDDYGVSYHLISNKSEKGFLLPDFKNIDYILKVSGEDTLNNITDLIQKIKKINIVITAFSIENIKSKYFDMFVF